MQPLRSVTIVGVGLIGGSIGLALRKRQLAAEVVGVGSRPETLSAALEVGAISRVAADLPTAVAQASLVVVCTPVGYIVDQVRAIAKVAGAKLLVTDAGSTKAEIVGQIDAVAGGADWNPAVRFVGSHPLAGNEKRGPRHADPELFAGRVVVVTPGQATAADDVRTVAQFWQALGARVMEMSPEDHDLAVAATSHLPHLAASAIAGSTPERYVTLTASGWQDTTRIAAGDPLLWRQIMLANRANLLAALSRLEDSLAQWRQALESADATALERLLTEAKRIRDAVGS